MRRAVASISLSNLRRLGRRLLRLVALAKPHWRVLAVGTVFLLIGSSMTLAYPQAIRVIIDQALAASGLQAINHAAVAMFGIFFVQGIAVGLRYYLFTVAGERIVTDLRHRLYQRIVAQEIGFFDSRRTGELLNRLSSDTGVLQNTVSVNISMALRNLVTVIGGIGLLFYTSSVLATLMLAVLPPVILGAGIMGRRIRRYARRAQDALGQAGEIAEETISGIRTVRAFAQEEREQARYGSAVLEAFHLARRRIRYVALFSGTVTFAGYAAVAVVLWYGGRLVVGHAMSVGDLTSFILYTLIVAFSLGALGSLWSDFMRASGASERVFELIDREPIIPTSGGRTLPHVRGELELDDVSFAYPSRPDVQVLHHVSLTLAAGEVVALVGPSGGGKSTIASLIPRFYDPDAGRLRLDGAPLCELDPVWLRRCIGIVAQDPFLLSTTVAANIRYGREDATDAEVEAAARAANAHAFIEGFPNGYETLVGERGVQLSGGQRQRVAIARAVLKDPRILILDEATSSLDAESEFLVKEALDRLMVGRTTLIIAHRLSTVVGADRVVVIDQGRVVQTGRHDELMDDPGGLYRRLVERQFFGAAQVA